MPRPRDCPTCGETFVPHGKRPRQRFCSISCGLRRGKEHRRFNYGLCVRKDGRTVIHCRDGALMFFYRGVMAADLGRLLTPVEIVHHINGDVTDDRIENLQIVSRAEHMNMHRADLEAGRR